MIALFAGSDNVVEADGVTNKLDDSYINDATATVVLRDADLAVVTGGSVSMSYVTGSNGTYRGTIPYTVSMTVGAKYYVDVTITGDGLRSFFRVPCRAQLPTGN